MSDFSPLNIAASDAWRQQLETWQRQPAHGLCLLPSLGLITVEGDDAATFLQGQLTQDHVLQPVGTWRHAAYCSPKGRMLATFRVGKSGAGSFALLCAADLAAGIAKRLSMFVLRAKVKVTHQTRATVHAWCGQAAGTALELSAPAPTAEQADKPFQALAGHGEGPMAWRLPDVAGQERWLITAAAGWTAPAELPALPLPAWSLLEIMSAEAQVTAATTDQFVPQTLNWEAVGGISFKKGCYTGQEVVARSQFRGTIKRRALLLQCGGPLEPGQELFTAQDTANPAARVVACAPWLDSAQGHLALAEVKLESALEPLRTAQGATAALAGPLPYPWPAQD